MTPMRNVFQVLDAAAQAKGEGLLFADEVESVTAPEVIARAEALAQGLSELGLERGDRAAFLVGGSVRHAIAFFACMRLGVVPCALHVRMTPAHLADAITWLGARLLVTDDANLALADAVRVSAEVDLALALEVPGAAASQQGWSTVAAVARAGEGSGLPHVAPDDLAYLIMSSGTTGEPKGIMHSHRTALASVASGRDVFGDVGADDVVLLAVTPSFAAWVNTVLPFTALGAQITFQGRFTPASFAAALGEQPVTYAPLPPTLWRMLLEDVRPILAPHLRYAFFSGEPGSAALVADLGDALPGVQLREAWLSSEAGCGAGIVADHALLRTPGCAHAAGLPVPQADVHLEAGQGAEPGTGVGSGEIVVESASVAVGYWGREPGPTSALQPGRWRTGDIAWVDGEGRFFIQGRTDNVINTGGIKVHAEEVETYLLSHPAVSFAAVIGVPDPVWGQAIEGHVVARTSVTEEELIRHVRGIPDVEAYKVPKRIVVHEAALPTTPSGKIYRKGLLPPSSPASGPH